MAGSERCESERQEQGIALSACRRFFSAARDSGNLAVGLVFVDWQHISKLSLSLVVGVSACFVFMFALFQDGVRCLD